MTKDVNIFSNFQLAKFCLVRNYGTPTPMLWSEIRDIMQSQRVRDLCNSIECADMQNDSKRKTELKSQLPAITVHACDFDENKRTNDYAHWNGLVCLEYDHLSNDEIEAFRKVEPPCPNIILCGKSCSGTGVWMLIEVPNSDYTQMEATWQAVHEAYCERIKEQTGLDVSEKVDKGLDLARYAIYLTSIACFGIPSATSKMSKNAVNHTKTCTPMCYRCVRVCLKRQQLVLATRPTRRVW